MESSTISRIGDIENPGSWTDVRAKVLQLWDSNSEKISQVGLLGDETGRIKFVSWEKSNLPLLEEEESYSLKNVVVDTWQGELQLNLNKTTEIEKINKPIESKSPELVGTVQRLVPKSGYIERCPECGRVLVDNHCVVHVDVEPEEDLRVKAALDSNSKIAILKGKTAEKILGVSIEEAEGMSEEDLNSIMRTKLLGKEFAFQGKDYDKNFLVTDFERLGD